MEVPWFVSYLTSCVSTILTLFKCFLGLHPYISFHFIENVFYYYFCFLQKLLRRGVEWCTCAMMKFIVTLFHEVPNEHQWC